MAFNVAPFAAEVQGRHEASAARYRLATRQPGLTAVNVEVTPFLRRTTPHRRKIVLHAIGV